MNVCGFFKYLRVSLFLLIGFGIVSCSSEISVDLNNSKSNELLYIAKNIASSNQIVNTVELRVGQTVDVFALRKGSDESYENIPAKWSILGSVGTLLVIGDGKQAQFQATTQGQGQLAVELDGLEKKINLVININNAPTVTNEALDVLANGGAVVINSLANDMDLDGDTISIVSNTAASNGIVIDNGDGTFNYTPNASFYGTDSFTYEVSDGLITNTGTVNIVVASPFSWTGRGADDLWSNNDNWCGVISANQCQGGSAPGSTDLAVFSSFCTNCNSELTANTDVSGILMESTYNGTLTQGTFDLTVGAEDFIQKAGTFTGGSNQITFDGDFLIQGGVFTAPSNNLRLNKIGSTLEIASGVSFSHNSGHIEINPTDSSNCGGLGTFVGLNIGQDITFNDFSVHLRDGDCNVNYENDLQMPGVGELTVLQDLHVYGGYFTNGVIYPQQDVHFHCTNTLSCSRGGQAKFVFNNGSVQQYFVDIGASTPIIELNSTGGSLSPGAGTTDVIFAGINIIDGDFIGSTGTVTLDGFYPRTADLVQTGGSIDLSNASLYLASSQNSGGNGLCGTSISEINTLLKLNVLGLHINQIDKGCNGYDNYIVNIAASGINVDGDLTLEAGVLNGGDIEVTGDISTECNATDDCWRGGNARVIANGITNQSLTQTLNSNFLAGEFEINKASGSLVLSGADDINFLNTDFIFTAGSIDFNGLNFIGINDFSEPAVAPNYIRTTELFEYVTCVDTCSVLPD